MRGMNLIGAAGWAESEGWRKIRLAKIEETMKAWDDLFFIQAGEEVFKKIPEVSDYSSFEDDMRQKLKEAGQYLKEGYTADVGAYLPPPTDLLNQLGELLRLDYIPPLAGKDMAADLIGLQIYYRSIYFSPAIEMVLDLSLCKLIRAICRLHAGARERGITTLSPTKAKKVKAVSRKTTVLEAFYLIDGRRAKGKSFDWIAKKIKDNLTSRNETADPDQCIKIPSERTIRRDLEQDNKAMKDLIALGVIKDKTGSVKEK